MIRYISIGLFLIGTAFGIDSKAEELKQYKTGSSDTVQYEFTGGITNNLQVTLLLETTPQNLSFELDFTAQTNFSRNAWLRVTNRVGSKLRLWTTNNMEVISTNTDLLAAMELPAKATVQEVMRGVPRRWRVTQWLYTSPGASITSASFGLQDYFSFSRTNELILQITPLIYQVEANLETVHLVEFYPIKLKLLPDGKVEKVE